MIAVSAPRSISPGVTEAILITTLDAPQKLHGDIGPGYFTFEGLGSQEAVQLLLKSITRFEPYDPAYEQLASTITQKLGYLACKLLWPWLTYPILEHGAGEKRRRHCVERC
jgi:hypothetical protein